MVKFRAFFLETGKNCTKNETRSSSSNDTFVSKNETSKFDSKHFAAIFVKTHTKIPWEITYNGNEITLKVILITRMWAGVLFTHINFNSRFWIKFILKMNQPN